MRFGTPLNTVAEAMRSACERVLQGPVRFIMTLDFVHAVTFHVSMAPAWSLLVVVGSLKLLGLSPIWKKHADTCTLTRKIFFPATTLHERKRGRQGNDLCSVGNRSVQQMVGQCGCRGAWLID